MNCVAESLRPVVEHAHNHHIQRLMVLGNFANLFAISPQQTADWFNEMYIDAYDWVVLPNVLGMALHADGGTLSTKPYIASANYIHKMSDYCKGCPFHQRTCSERTLVRLTPCTGTSSTGTKNASLIIRGCR